ncbi:MAG TPA: hypothetical protein VK043_07690 [Burkholderiales bacterium]|nr:hypothetical protein [Burkholderiales bacterium]
MATEAKPKGAIEALVRQPRDLQGVCGDEVDARLFAEVAIALLEVLDEDEDACELLRAPAPARVLH